MSDPHPIAIVGGGLTGLALARHLHRAGKAFELYEARSRFGGRVLSRTHKGVGFDLGPSWFWPGQPRMAQLAAEFGIAVFEQYATGALAYEDQNGQVHRDQGWSSMAGSLRLDGGMAALSDALVQSLPAERLHLDHKLCKVEASNKLIFENGETCEAQHIVLALPPRLIAGLDFETKLETQTLAALSAIPTWMAGHAKYVAIYDTPFWRDEGWSGDAMSRRGPLAEIHDASARAGSPAALFGFLGVPAELRAEHADAIEDACLAQLTRIFGPQAAKPSETFYEDWASKSETAVPADQTPPSSHPHYRPLVTGNQTADGTIIFAATELATEHGGFLEGALCAAEDAAVLLRV